MNYLRKIVAFVAITAVIMLSSLDGVASAQSEEDYEEYEGTAGYEVVNPDPSTCTAIKTEVDLESGTLIQAEDSFIMVEILNHDPELTNYDGKTITHLEIFFGVWDDYVDRISWIEAPATIWIFSGECDDSYDATQNVVYPHMEEMERKGFVPEFIDGDDRLNNGWIFELFPQSWELDY